MGGYNWIGFAFVLIGAVVLASLLGRIPALRRFRGLLAIAVVLRILGSQTRYEIIMGPYRGYGDAIAYYHWGELYATHLWALDFSILESASWWGGTWWGTQGLRYLSGFVITFIGPSIRGEFLAFALMAFLGTVALVLAFHRSSEGANTRLYAALLWLWPSLWFWPSSVGKEAPILLGIGLTVLGYVGRNDRIRIVPLAAGLFIAFAIRPHVAAVLALAMVGAEWLRRGRWNFSKVVQGLVIAAGAVFLLQRAAGQFGLDLWDLEGVQEYQEYRSGLTERGGSNIGPAPQGLTGIPMAFVNILARPFPFEAHNVFALFAAFEVLLLWYLVWRRRAGVKEALRNWRQNRFLRFAVPFAFMYILMIGLTFSNLGIIARQRVLVFPFLLAILASAGLTRAGNKRRRAGPRLPRF